MGKNELKLNNTLSPLVSEIKDILNTARSHIVREVNNQLLMSYWKIGEIIVKYEQNNNIRAEYGSATLKHLSKVLTNEFGKGFSRVNLQNMRNLYIAYPKCQTLSDILNWSHYCELLSITDTDKRSFYEKEV